ncbi:MAG: PAS domain S-box protein, partial [Cyclobacteriaceae bacterium]|nr:PAS domain S-box protein [Cyclobacteriaceae bacterium]
MENKNALNVITERSLKIILVEDDYVDQKSFIKTLSKLAPNYEITAVETVAEAFEKIDNGIFDIIVTDYFLPDGTGLDIISKYQNHLSIFITGSDQIQTAIEAMKTGARDYLVKDYNLNYLNMAPMVIEKIYENYQATIRAAEAERTYKELFEKAHDMIQSVDGEGRFVYVNPAWEKALGYTQEEAVNIHFLDIVHPDYHDHCNLIFKQIMNGEQLKGVDIKFISKSGKIVIVEGNITPKILYNNVILSSMSIFRDITEKKLAEEKLHQINEELEIKVSERTLELQQLNKNLATSNFELDTFLYRSSHNLMGPVARFEGLINLLGIPEGTIDKEIVVEKFRQNTDEMKKMITKLTDVSRISGYKNEDSEVNISELTNQILEQLKPDTM